MGEMSEMGRLVLLGAPLGNPADASTRLGEVLATADVVAAEDTRRLSRLARDLDVTIPGRIVSYFEGNEERRTPELVEVLTAGYLVALVTDGGMPSVSDPGYRLVRAALDAGIPVTAAPGPSAVTTALALSGLPCDRFCFEGFLPRSPGARRARLRALAAEERTLVLFEAPHRVAAALTDLADAFGAERPAALCRELTKTYEEVLRRPLGDLARWAADGDPRGEITLVVAGAPAAPPSRPDDDALRALVAEREAAGRTRRDAITDVATAHGLRRRDVYTVVHQQ
ncbi:16S rRNA (cytidine1402-2'-O)-methyltransferase [Micromonospora phaseoli]|uniref:Ribosomal RNA small subunit methyltransferase I n=1 Tax=Micromonospora phaseoli TaxID=1144548 RepID=A0A1H6ZJD1_9ACTN|nr:16S rRNA (cytidine(1402)-2'-O)-methyltransferase [Micromonospora phaseoli]PZV97167.1 16S rRNA (cytidine1402-2'-O)-methyltransferase [Micromonospora phaseoli]GIJ77253.1 ribosomal RNA small subunit methyltransferase I [Micromonospora phaseoli]SEJ53539.1 16S rRNA (cytidine1402-2'-O)-methyltransferase [Micromonospora phaseoli]